MSRTTISSWCAAMLLAAATTHAQTTITQWTFNSNPGDSNTATGTLAPALGAGTAACYSIAPAQPLAECIFSNGAGSTDPGPDNSGWQTRGYQDQGIAPGTVGVEFSLSTENFSQIIISWDHRHSNTSSRYVNLFYATDGVTFVEAPFPPFEANAGDTWFNQRTVNLTGLPGVDNNPNFRFRISPVFAPDTTTYVSANASSTYASTGTHRFDMVTVAGTASSSIPPAASAAASPGAVCAGGGLVTLTVAAQSGVNPPSTGLAVAADLTSIGGSAAAMLFDDGTNGDPTPGDNLFTLAYTVPGAVAIGPKTILFTVSDSQSRSSTASAGFAVADCSQNASSQVVISQVYGGGGNVGAIYNADFIELFNRSASPVSLNGWSVQYASPGAAGGFDNPADQAILAGAIQPGQYMLVQFSAIGASGSALPTPDFVGTGGIGNTGGRAALVHSTTLIGTDCANPAVEDLVGWGAAACFEGAAAAGGTDNITGIVRKLAGAQDSNHSFNDFEVATPNARNRATGGFLAGYGSASADTVCAGSDVGLSVSVSAAAVPPSTGIQVRANLSALNGSVNQLLVDNGGGNWSMNYSVPAAVSQGIKSIPLIITDAQGRSDTSLLALTVVTCNNSASRIVVSGFFGGGGNAGAPFAADHIEIFNRSQSPVDLTGWSVQYADAANAPGFITTRVISLSGTIGAGEYRLIQVSAAGANGVPLPTPDFTPAVFFGMDNQSGRIAIVRLSEPLGSNCASPNIEDLVGYGSAALCFEGFARTVDISNTTGGYRLLGGCQDFDQSAVDFDITAPLFLPLNSSSPANLCPGGPTFCDADWCRDASVGVPDIFCFLSAWFANDPAARNYGGTPGVPAIFAFLSSWFSTGQGPCVP